MRKRTNRAGMWTPDVENDTLASDIQFALDSTSGEILDMDGTTVETAVAYLGDIAAWTITIPNGRKFRLVLMEVQP